MNVKIKILLLLVSLFLSFNVSAESIKNITVRGNNRIEKSTIIEYTGLHVGDQFGDNSKSEIIKKLYESYLFEEITLDFVNQNLIISIKEYPLVCNVVFIGNNKLKTNILEKEILTEKGQALSKFKLQSDVNKIKEIYKKSGRFIIDVTTKVEMLKNKGAKVIFNISEGPKTSIRDIYFFGNDNYRENELKSVLFTKESSWLRFFDNADVYDPDRLEYDKELLKGFYTSVGFADFHVISAVAQLSSTKDYFTIIFSIEEGDKYYFGALNLVSNIENINTDDVKKLINIKKGSIYNALLIDKVSENISEYLTNKGYPQINVYSKLDKNLKDNLVNITFIIDKAERVFINRIEVNGNVKTSDKVIRRELKIQEGDIFNRSAIEQWENNLRNLDFFERVRAQIELTKYIDKIDLKADVKEKSTSSIGIDGGYNSGAGPFVGATFTDKNLLGSGRSLDARWSMAKKNVNYVLGISDPYLFDRDLSGGINLFNMVADSDDDQPYNSKIIGTKFQVGYHIFENLTHDIFYDIRQEKTTTSGEVTSFFIKEQLGKFLTSSVGHSLTYEILDSRIIPKNGYKISGTQEYAGVGGDVYFLKHEIEGNIYKSFFKNLLTLKISGETGYIFGVNGKKVKINNRFNLGDYSFRGFAPGGIGPRDINTREGLGGQKYYKISTELLFPLGFPKEVNLNGNVFVDFGSLWSYDKFDKNKKLFYNKNIFDTSKPRLSTGFGFIWITPIIPIKIDFAWPIVKQKYDKKKFFHFKMATHF